MTDRPYIPIYMDEGFTDETIVSIGDQAVDRIARFEIKHHSVPAKLEYMDFAKVEERVLAHMTEEAKTVAEHATMAAFYGKKTVTGTLTCNFANTELYHDLAEAMDRSSDLIRVFDWMARSRIINRKERKAWAKRKKRFLAESRRQKARRLRRQNGKAIFF